MTRWLSAFYALSGCHLMRQPGRTFLTILGVALGVAVLVATDIATESAVASFRRTVDRVSGAADLTLRGNGGALDGDAVAKVAAAKGVRSLAPLIEGQGLYENAAGEAEVVMLAGTDFLASEENEEETIREFDFQLAEDVSFVDLLITPYSLIFEEDFARRNYLNLGDTIQLQIGGVARDIRIAGLVDSGSFGDAYDGNVAITDIGNADYLLGRDGKIDRIDMILEEDANAEEVAERLQQAFDRSILVETPEARTRQSADMLAAFRFNLRTLGYIALLVGAFLVYNSISIAVVRRRPEIGTLRAIGIDRNRVRGIFLLEGAIFGICGGALGIVLGIILAQLLLGTVTDAISINFFRVGNASLEVTPGTLVAVIALATFGAFAAAYIPASEAASTPAANTMRRGTGDSSARKLRWLAPAGLVLLIGGGILLSIKPPTAGLPITGYAVSLMVVAAFLLWTRPALGWTARILRPIYAKLFGAEGILAVAGTSSALGRSAVAIGGLTVSVAMTVSVGVMVSSFRGTVNDWMAYVLRADLYVTPAWSGPGRPDPFDDSVLATVENLPGVREVHPFTSRQVMLDGRPVMVGAGRLALNSFQNKSMDGRTVSQLMRDAAENGTVVVSEAFALKRNVAAGDTVLLPTAQGEVPLTVEGVYQDYSTEKGFLVMDRDLYIDLYDDRSLESLSFYLAEDTDRREVRQALEALSQSNDAVPPMSIVSNTELRDMALAAFDQTFRVTWVLLLIAIMVAALGVATTLLAQIVDRREEIATLRYLGATRARIGRVVLLESSLLGLVGVPLGVFAGLILSYILSTHIMAESFGWTISMRVPWLLVASLALIVYASTLLAGYLPARSGVRLVSSSRSTTIG